jgi:phosphoribosylaminoimidazole carboxylase PurE protein
VLILMGSDSDLPVMQEAGRVLTEFGVPFDMTVASAHRSPERAAKFAREAEGQGVGVIIAAAGGAAHLAGAAAAQTVLPVIGVPLTGSAINGLDALLATVQMPPGVPVATVAIGGARNAALLAVQILAAADHQLRDRFRAYKERLAREVEEKAARIGVAAGGGLGMAPPPSRASDSTPPTSGEAVSPRTPAR